jgi:hypothetical protein
MDAYAVEGIMRHIRDVVNSGLITLFHEITEEMIADAGADAIGTPEIVEPSNDSSVPGRLRFPNEATRERFLELLRERSTRPSGVLIKR